MSIGKNFSENDELPAYLKIRGIGLYACFVVIVVALLAGIGTAPVSGQNVTESGGLAIPSVNTSPSSPAAGQPVVVEVTVKNTGAGANVQVMDIRLRSGFQGKSIDSIQDVGVLGQGESTTVSLTIPEAPEGGKQYYVESTARTLSSSGGLLGSTTARTTVIVGTQSTKPSIVLDLPTTVADVPNQANITIVNPTSRDLTGVQVTVNDSPNSKTLNSVKSGNSTFVPIDYRRKGTGKHYVKASAEYSTPVSTQTQKITETKSGEYVSLERQVDVQAKVSMVNGSNDAPRVQAVVSNVGNSFVDDVVVSASNTAGDVLAQQGLGRIPSRNDETALLDVPTKQTQKLNISAEYEINGNTYESFDSLTYSPGAASVVVTDISSTGGDIQGTVGNTGGSKVEGAVVKLGSGAGATETFVGEVETGDSETFSASPPSNAGKEMTIQVTYKSSGKQFNYTKTVKNPAIGGMGTDEGSEDAGSGGGTQDLPLTEIVASAIIIIIVIAVVYKGWIRRTPDDQIDEDEDVEDLIDDDEESIFTDE
ncbi:MAG: hypothetical protein ABEK59_12775 [Halobacteria archaeon]